MLAVRGPTPKPTMPVTPGTDDGAIGSDDAPIATTGDSAPSDDAGGAIATVGATHECSETADCDGGYVCSSGSCTDDKGNTVEHYCTQTSDCDQGYECQASTSLCKSKNVTAVNKYCETSVDCFPGYQCLEGTCVTAVRGPTPSPTPPHSAAGSPAASAAADASDSSSSDGASHYCDETADCDSGYTCDTTTSRCTETKTNSTGLMTYCETSVDCQPGYQCMEGQCATRCAARRRRRRRSTRCPRRRPRPSRRPSRPRPRAPTARRTSATRRPTATRGTLLGRGRVRADASDDASSSLSSDASAPGDVSPQMDDDAMPSSSAVLAAQGRAQTGAAAGVVDAPVGAVLAVGAPRRRGRRHRLAATRRARAYRACPATSPSERGDAGPRARKRARARGGAGREIDWERAVGLCGRAVRGAESRAPFMLAAGSFGWIYGE